MSKVFMSCSSGSDLDVPGRCHPFAGCGRWVGTYRKAGVPSYWVKDHYTLCAPGFRYQSFIKMQKRKRTPNSSAGSWGGTRVRER